MSTRANGYRCGRISATFSRGNTVSTDEVSALISAAVAGGASVALRSAGTRPLRAAGATRPLANGTKRRSLCNIVIT